MVEGPHIINLFLQKGISDIFPLIMAFIHNVEGNKWGSKIGKACFELSTFQAASIK